MFIKRLLFAFSLLTLGFNSFAEQDNYLWLEEVDSETSMQWVKKQNKLSNDKLTKNPLYNELYQQALKVLNGKSRLPTVTQNGKWLYNFWKDDKNPRGVYRRTTLKQFNKEKPKWQTVLDMDEYSKQHGENYDYHGMTCLPPKRELCLVNLSPGGSDASIIKEFNLKKRKFVKNGFEIPLAKTRVSWIDKNTLFVGTDFGEGSMSQSGYPIVVKKWQRGTDLKEAETVYKADEKSMSASGISVNGDDTKLQLINDSTSFWTTKKYQIYNGKTVALALPASANLNGMYQNKLVVSLKENWEIADKKFIQGEIVLVDASLLRGEEGQIESIIKPDDKSIIENINVADSGLLITVMEDVKARLCRMIRNKDGSWKVENIPFPDNGTLSVTSIDDKTGDFFVQFESFITPPTLYHVNSKTLKPKLLKQQAESFDGSKMLVKQYFTESIDGTKVPYFVVMNKDTEFNGKNPTHIFSYGGFRNTLAPSYSGSYEALSGAYGQLWLERGGVFVLANIRGGGEYGPAWHQAALLKNRHKSYEDFESVARDLFKRNITSAEHLGIEGRSNGGLLVTATMTRHPELYSAVICGAPLIDMKRYHKLLAGASWMAEYGNPDQPEMWDYIKTYSPYQNVDKNVKYPSIFFYTSTRDDRVHPAHARKMAAKMLEYDNDVEYFENIEGGHYGFSTNEQLAHRLALSYTHLWTQLK